MKYVEKYVLVPYDEYNAHVKNDSPRHDTSSNLVDTTLSSSTTHKDNITGHDAVVQEVLTDEVDNEGFNVENFISYLKDCSTDSTNNSIHEGGSFSATEIQPQSTPIDQPDIKKPKKGWISI